MTDRLTGQNAAPRTPRRFANRLLLMGVLGVLPSLLAAVAAVVLAPLPLSALAGLAGVAVVGAALALYVLWQSAARVDALSARLTEEAGLAPGRDPLAALDAAFAVAERRLSALARRGDPARRDDPTTGLPNRQTVMRRGRDEITRARRNQQPLAVALMSLDIGPPADTPMAQGQQDRALRLTAEILMQGLRAYDVVGRWEHDVFVALIPEAEVEHAVSAIERIRTLHVESPAVRSGEAMPAMHGGVAVLQPDDATVAEIAARAEKALARARSGVGAAVQAAPGPRQRPVSLTTV